MNSETDSSLLIGNNNSVNEKMIDKLNLKERNPIMSNIDDLTFGTLIKKIRVMISPENMKTIQFLLSTDDLLIFYNVNEFIECIAKPEKIGLIQELMIMCRRFDILRGVGPTRVNVKTWAEGRKFILCQKRILMTLLRDALTVAEMDQLQEFLSKKVDMPATLDHYSFLTKFCTSDKYSFTLLEHSLQAINKTNLSKAFTVPFTDQVPTALWWFPQPKREFSVPICAEPSFCVNQHVLRHQQATAAATGNFYSYPMNAVPRGICTIINNKNFCEDGKFKNSRKGSEKDVDNMKELFLHFGFHVDVYSNLSACQMEEVSAHYAGMSHKNYNCFVMIIMSHGTADQQIRGSDYQLIDLDKLMIPFRSCLSLVNKPKLYFLQACQGSQKMNSLDVDGNFSVTEQSKTEQHWPNLSGRCLPPSHCDELMGLATVNGYVSYRCKNEGSWYMRHLAQLLRQHSPTEDLASILTMVNQAVSNECADEVQSRQIPEPRNRLRGKVYFAPLEDALVNKYCQFNHNKIMLPDVILNKKN